MPPIDTAKAAYYEAMIDYECLESQCRTCKDPKKLPELNSQLEQANALVLDCMDKWSQELGRVLDTPCQDLEPAISGIRYIDGWQHDSSGGRLLAS